MHPITSLSRSLASFLAACITCLASFGLALGLFDLATRSRVREFELAAVILSASTALAIGGFTASTVARSRKVAHSSAFGLLFGAIAFTYIFGPTWQALLATALATLLGALGAWIYRKVTSRRGVVRPLANRSGT